MSKRGRGRPRKVDVISYDDSGGSVSNNKLNNSSNTSSGSIGHDQYNSSDNCGGNRVKESLSPVNVKPSTSRDVEELDDEPSRSLSFLLVPFFVYAVRTFGELAACPAISSLCYHLHRCTSTHVHEYDRWLRRRIYLSIVVWRRVLVDVDEGIGRGVLLCAFEEEGSSARRTVVDDDRQRVV
ncbi:hypothetical protein V9T40_006454 [Parthenolecanium corni]|uniref:Uncharacterized protein n=1 Tax=Parthenolecanium corni TaxID=536013 RepID=A0AAN9Y5J5_9HEMI